MEEFHRLEQFLRTSLFISSFVAVATLLLMELIKPVVKSFFQRRLLRRWTFSSQFFDEPFRFEGKDSVRWLRDLPALAHVDISDAPLSYDTYRSFERDLLSAGLPPRLETDMLMRLLSNRANAALEAPSRNMDDFLSFTRGAPVEDLAAALYLDRVRVKSPELHSSIANLRAQEGEGPSPLAAAIAAVRESLSGAVERNLDGLQLQLTAQWRTQGRMLAMLIGFCVALAAGTGSGAIGARVPVILATPLLLAAIGFGSWKLFEWFEDNFYDRPTWWKITLVSPFAILGLGMIGLAGWRISRMGPLSDEGAAGPILVLGVMAGLLASLAYDAVKSIRFFRR
jgi:hypothetical protein